MKSSAFDKAAWTELLGKLNLELPPVAVSYSIKPPEGVQNVEENVAFCDMLKKAHEGKALYISPENHTCGAGPYVIGKGISSAYETGEFGAGLQVFNHFRAMARLYDVIPRIDPGRNINYIAFSPLDKLTFEPDLLVVAASVDQAEILLRASSYSTGKVWTSRSTGVMGCAWIFILPYLTGELNYIITGMGHGMKMKKVLPPGRLLISIPYDLFPTMLQNLQTMPWVLPAFRPDGGEFMGKLMMELGLKKSE